MRHVLLRSSAALAVLALPRVAQALPDLWQPDASHYDYEYTLDLSHGDPFTTPYNRVLNPTDPQSLPEDHDTSADFYLFEPRRLDGQPTTPRPLVVYFHGASLWPSPTQVRSQIEHYVQSGYSVLYPMFCNDKLACVDFVRQDGNAMTALMDGRYTLWQDDHVGLEVRADGKENIAFVAQSLGSHIATRLAGWLGHLDRGWGALPTPQALIFHDAAGHESSIRSAVGSLGEGFYQWVINGLEDHGLGWDPIAGGPRTYEIKDVLPLTPELLSGVPSSTLVLLLAAEETYETPNAFETARRIYAYVPAAESRAYVVPSQCATEVNGSVSYECPPDLAASSHSAWHHYYFSSHVLFGIGDDALMNSAVVLQTTACLEQARTGSVQPLCTGSFATFSGVWQQPDGTGSRLADTKFDWSLPAP